MLVRSFTEKIYVDHDDYDDLYYSYYADNIENLLNYFQI